LLTGVGSLGGCRLGGLGRSRGTTTVTVAPCRPVATGGAVSTTASTAGGTGASGGLGLTLGAGPCDLTLVDPDLHADTAEGRAGLVEPVVDVGTQRVQRDATLTVELGARHLSAVEAAGALDPDALGTGAHRGLDGLAHGTTELHAARQLLSNTLGDELGVDLGVLHLEDVELHLLAGELLELAADAVCLGPTTTDDD